MKRSIPHDVLEHIKSMIKEEVAKVPEVRRYYCGGYAGKAGYRGQLWMVVQELLLPPGVHGYPQALEFWEHTKRRLVEGLTTVTDRLPTLRLPGRRVPRCGWGEPSVEIMAMALVLPPAASP